MMQESIDTILAFVTMIKERDSAFSAKDWQGLSQLAQSLEKLNKEENFAIANTILDWCDEHPNIRHALKEACHKSFSIDLVTNKEEQIDNNKLLVRQIIQEALKQPPPNYNH
ncbi:MAG: hypothetical protein AAGF26_16670 [Cyanobacteria bacterium P01_G01_bin.49]